MKSLPEMPDRRLSIKKKSMKKNSFKLSTKKLPEMPSKEENIFKIEPSVEIPTFPDVKKQEMNFTSMWLQDMSG